MKVGPLSLRVYDTVNLEDVKNIFFTCTIRVHFFTSPLENKTQGRSANNPLRKQYNFQVSFIFSLELWLSQTDRFIYYNRWSSTVEPVPQIRLCTATDFIFKTTVVQSELTGHRQCIISCTDRRYSDNSKSYKVQKNESANAYVTTHEY